MRDSTYPNSKIKFNCSQDGRVDATNGETVFSDMFLIGALALTRKYDKASFYQEYQTDVNGLKFVEMKSQQAIETISEAVVALGSVMASANLEEVPDHQIISYLRLISGLGELMEMLICESQEIRPALIECDRKQKAV